jgi:MoxR-like ATPase
MAIIEGQHVLLIGPKSTGKNVLANNLAYFCGRPIWDISFHGNIDAGSLIGTDTFKNNEVSFRPGMVYQCANYGGFGVLDEVNMAKNEAMAVLHSVTDDRRVIDVPGYERTKLHEATRFIGTMNYGYAGTRDLNEAFASRFVIINMPQQTNEGITKLLRSKYPTADANILGFFAGALIDLEKKAENAEISTKAVDLRGVLAALGMVKRGMKPFKAMEYCVINKCFDQYERDVVKDVVQTRVPECWEPEEVFRTNNTITVDFSK